MIWSIGLHWTPESRSVCMLDTTVPVPLKPDVNLVDLVPTDT